MFYDEWLVCRVMLNATGADIHQVAQHVTAYMGAARILEGDCCRSAALRSHLEEILDRHERILRSYLLTHNLPESQELVEKLVAV